MIGLYRLAHMLYGLRVPILPSVLSLLNRLLTGAHVPAEASIGPRAKVAYGGAGLVIHPRAVIGCDCLLSPGVIIGGRGSLDVPIIGDRVRLFAHSVVLGGVRVGDGATIAPNAVVVTDVPAGAVVVAPLGLLRAPRKVAVPGVGAG